MVKPSLGDTISTIKNNLTKIHGKVDLNLFYFNVLIFLNCDFYY
jgi:hypothetical protein